MPTGPALRAGDTVLCPLMDGPKPHVGGPITPAAAAPTVMIGGMPAAVANAVPGGIVCVSPAPNGIAMGSMTVMIGGFPAARLGDMSMHGTPIAPGTRLSHGDHRRLRPGRGGGPGPAVGRVTGSGPEGHSGTATQAVVGRPGLSRGETMSAGTKDDPWRLTTPPGTSTYEMYVDPTDDEVLVCQVGSTKLTYRRRAIEDLSAWLVAQGDWVDLGAADEKKPAKDGTVEAFGRSPDNPVGGWYGLRNGYRGRFGMYLPPLLEHLGLAELTHDARNNRMRAAGIPADHDR